MINRLQEKEMYVSPQLEAISFLFEVGIMAVSDIDGRGIIDEWGDLGTDEADD